MPAASASPRFSSAVIDLNLVAPLNFAQQVHGVMDRQEGGGTIINIGSIGGQRPSPGVALRGSEVRLGAEPFVSPYRLAVCARAAAMRRYVLAAGVRERAANVR